MSAVCSLDSLSVKRVLWTSDEDDLLREVLTSNDAEKWAALSLILPNKSIMQCFCRIPKLLPDLNSSIFEDAVPDILAPLKCDDTKDIYSCPICLDIMVNSDRHPVTLNDCGHTFCKSCLTEIQKRGSRRKCPLCCKAIKSDLHINHALKQIIEAFYPELLYKDYSKHIYEEDGDDEVRINEHLVYAIQGLQVMKQNQIEHNYNPVNTALTSGKRTRVAQWMLFTCEHYKLNTIVAHAAVSYLDRILFIRNDCEDMTRDDFNLLAVICITIAGKYYQNEYEIDALLQHLSRIVPDSSDYMKHEVDILIKLDWKLNAYTPLAFLNCFISFRGGILKDDDVLSLSALNKPNMELHSSTSTAFTSINTPVKVSSDESASSSDTGATTAVTACSDESASSSDTCATTAVTACSDNSGKSIETGSTFRDSRDNCFTAPTTPTNAGNAGVDISASVDSRRDPSSVAEKSNNLMPPPTPRKTMRKCLLKIEDLKSPFGSDAMDVESVKSVTSKTTSLFDSEQANKELRRNVRMKAHSLALEIVTCCLLDDTYKSYLASNVAIAIVYFIRMQIKILESQLWSNLCKEHIGSIESESETVSNEILDIVSLLKNSSKVKKIFHTSGPWIWDVIIYIQSKLHQIHNNDNNKKKIIKKYTNDDVIKILSCPNPNCNHRMNTDANSPICISSCSHTLCKKCVDEYSIRGPGLQSCPVCSKEICDEDRTNLTNNHLLKSTIQLVFPQNLENMIVSNEP